MDIRSKLYPYPVLSSANDDYTGSSFTFTPNISKGPREVVFDAEFAGQHAAAAYRRGAG